MLLLLLLGGNETSTALITNLVWRLLEQRSRWAAVVADPALVDAAVEESLRHDPPVLGLFRTPTHDVTRHGVTIPAGGRMVRVSDVAHLALGNAPSSIDRYNRMRQISVNANLDRLKITLGDAISQARGKVGELGLKAGYQ